MAKHENFTAGRVANYHCPSGKLQALYWDGKTPGLGLRVTAAGSKSYIFETQLYKKTIRITIGDVRTWEISKAQAEATRLKTLTDQGIDPREEIRKAVIARQAKLDAEISSQKHTLEKLHAAYCDYLHSKGKLNTARVYRSLFKTHAPPELAKMAAKNVEDENIADALRAIATQSKLRTAAALRTSLLAAYNIALHARLNATLPAHFKDFDIRTNPVAAIPTFPSQAEDRVITSEELQKYLTALDDRLTDKALKLALFAGGQRMEQILRLTKGDWNSQTSSLRLLDPKGRRTQARVHVLPLAPIAAAIVEELCEALSEHSEKLFLLDSQTPGKRAKKICEQIGITPPFNLRDIRRTVETRMAELGISRDIRAQVLSHGLSGVQDKHYDRHSYFQEKQEALKIWEKSLAKLSPKRGQNR